MQDIHNKYHKTVEEVVGGLAPWKWLTALPQIVSRLLHPNQKVFELLKNIIVNIFKEYPHQALWLVAAVTKSNNRSRRQRATDVMNTVKAQVCSTKYNH